MNEHSSIEHRETREMLGAYALDGLPDQTRASLRAHLDGCAACREELAEIAPLASALRLVDPDALSAVPAPPADLGQRIADRIAEERGLTQARSRRNARHATARRPSRQVLTAAAAAVLVLSALAAGAALGRATGPQVTATGTAPRLPVEDILLRSVDRSVNVDAAVVVSHTWGVEAKFEASGLAAGQVYRAAFRSDDGRLLPAGEFLGVGDKALKCNMQAALLRDATTGFVVTDQAGRTVLTAEL